MVFLNKLILMVPDIWNLMEPFRRICGLVWVWMTLGGVERSFKPTESPVVLIWWATLGVSHEGGGTWQRKCEVCFSENHPKDLLYFSWVGHFQPDKRVNQGPRGKLKFLVLFWTIRRAFTFWRCHSTICNQLHSFHFERHGWRLGIVSRQRHERGAKIRPPSDSERQFSPI